MLPCDPESTYCGPGQLCAPLEGDAVRVCQPDNTGGTDGADGAEGADGSDGIESPVEPNTTSGCAVQSTANPTPIRFGWVWLMSLAVYLLFRRTDERLS